MLSKLELIINGQYQLYLPAEGITISLLSNEFNLLTNNTAENRPLSITETFEIPLTENRHVFEQLRGEDKYAELKYNDITLIAGPVFEYSADEQKKVIRLPLRPGLRPWSTQWATTFSTSIRLTSRGTTILSVRSARRAA